MKNTAKEKQHQPLADISITAADGCCRGCEDRAVINLNEKRESVKKIDTLGQKMRDSHIISYNYLQN